MARIETCRNVDWMQTRYVKGFAILIEAVLSLRWRHTCMLCMLANAV